MEITMRKFTVLVIPLIAALTAQAAAASEHHYTRTKGHAAASAQWRNSNAYAAPADIAVQPDSSHYNGGQMLMPGAY
jgi:hypothetical protein